MVGGGTAASGEVNPDGRPGFQGGEWPVSLGAPAGVAKWHTQATQNRPGAIPCGFESRPRHCRRPQHRRWPVPSIAFRPTAPVGCAPLVHIHHRRPVLLLHVAGRVDGYGGVQAVQGRAVEVAPVDAPGDESRTVPLGVQTLQLPPAAPCSGVPSRERRPPRAARGTRSLPRRRLLRGRNTLLGAHAGPLGTRRDWRGWCNRRNPLCGKGLCRNASFSEQIVAPGMGLEGRSVPPHTCPPHTCERTT